MRRSYLGGIRADEAGQGSDVSEQTDVTISLTEQIEERSTARELAEFIGVKQADLPVKPTRKCHGSDELRNSRRAPFQDRGTACRSSAWSRTTSGMTQT